MKLKLRTKLLAGFLLVSLIAGSVGVVGIVNIQKEADLFKVLYQKNLQAIIQTSAIELNLSDIRIAMRDHILASLLTDKEKAEEKIATIHIALVNAIEKRRILIDSDKERQAFEPITINLNQFFKGLE